MRCTQNDAAALATVMAGMRRIEGWRTFHDRGELRKWRTGLSGRSPCATKESAIVQQTCAAKFAPALPAHCRCIYSAINQERHSEPACNIPCADFENVNAWNETIRTLRRLLSCVRDACVGVAMSYLKVEAKHEVPNFGGSSPRKRVIERQALPDELAGLVRDMIIRGELRPGSRLNMPRLCSRFGVSRTPLREALKILATEGLVELMPNRSAVVLRVTDDVINELIPIVGALAALAGRMACARLNDDALAELDTMHQRLLHHVEQRDERSYMEVESAILQAVFIIAGNGALKKIYETLTIKLQWQSASLHAVAEWRQAAEVQKQLHHALQIRDGDLWALVVYRHVLHRAALLLRRNDLAAGGTAPGRSGGKLSGLLSAS
jgi:DNA-binding GntR family transcriptional regulator